MSTLRKESKWIRRLGKRLRMGSIPLKNDGTSERWNASLTLLSWASQVDRKRWFVDLIRLALEIHSYNDKLAWRMCFALCEEYTKRIKEKDV